MEVNFAPNRTAVLKLMLIVAPLAPIAFFVFPSDSKLFGIFIGLAIATVLVLPRLVPMLFTDTAIRLTSEGLFDRTAGLGFIPWKLLSSARLEIGQLSKVIILEPVDMFAFVNHFSFPKKQFLQYSVNKGAPPSLSVSFVDADPNEVLQTLLSFIDQFGNRKSLSSEPLSEIAQQLKIPQSRRTA